MNPDLENLAALDAIDRELDQVQAGFAAEREALRDAQSRIVDLRVAGLALQSELDASRARQHEAERRMKGSKARMLSAKQALETGVGDYRVAERQIEDYARQLDLDETAVLTELEAQDELVARVRDNEEALLTATRELDDLETRSPTVLGEGNARKERLLADRDVRWEALPTELRNRYRAHADRKKRAVALVVDGACGACSSVVQSQQRIELGRGRLETCRNCHRWLILKE